MSAYPKYFLRSPEIRSRACQLVAGLPVDQDKPLVIEIKEMTRSLAQNSMLWACLTDIAEQVVWHGKKLTSEDWKCLFSASLEKQRAEPGLDGGFVVMAVSTRKQSQKWFSDLFELMHAFGAEHDVRWTEQDKWGGRY